VAELLALAELELQVDLLELISRGAHLDGPIQQARRLVGLWKVDSGDDVPLAQAYRLLDAKPVAGVIRRTVGTEEYADAGDPRYWIFPGLGSLEPQLRALSWQAMLDGELVVEAKPGVRGKRYRAVSPAELVRLTPDWTVSRLLRDGVDVFIDARVRRPSPEVVKKTWREHPDRSAVVRAMAKIAESGSNPSQQDLLSMLRVEFPGLPRQMMRDAFPQVPQLRGRRGYRTKSST